MKLRNKRLAVFDIDGTVFRSSLVIELVKELIVRGTFSDAVRRDIEDDYSAWLNRKGTYESYIYKVVALYRTHIIGSSHDDVQMAVDSMVSKHKDKVYRFTRDCMSILKRRGYDLLALSGSPISIVSGFAKSAGFDYYCGTSYKVSDGIICMAGDTINKREELTGFLKKATRPYALKDIIAFGDTEGDIPILEMAGYPVVFNPNEKLVKYSSQKEWPIVVERKDVIYRINAGSYIMDTEAFLRDLLPNV